MIIFFAYVFAIVASVIEATVVPLPLTVFVIILFFIFNQKPWVLLLAIIAGVILDSLTFRVLGESSLFFVCALGVFLVYQRKFETQHMLFQMSYITFISSMYVCIFDTRFVMADTVVVICFAGIIFGMIFLLKTFRKQAQLA